VLELSTFLEYIYMFIFPPAAKGINVFVLHNQFKKLLSGSKHQLISSDKS